MVKGLNSLIFSISSDVVTNLIAMNITLTNMFFYCTATKRNLLQWRMMSTDPPGIMFVGFFCRNTGLLLLIRNGNTCPPALCEGETKNQ